MNSPILSVIVPVYNVEKYLYKCIDSILSQTFTDFELLLINDGSTDKSKSILEEYRKKDHRVRVFHTENKGVSCARNLGIERATGEWVCFVDSDDWIEPTHFADFFISEFNSNTIVYQSISFDYEDKGVLVPFFKYEAASFLISAEELIFKNKILHNGCPYCKLFNLNLIKDNNIRFNPDISIHEDHCFVWQYLGYINRIELRDRCSYHYMKRGIESLTSKRHTMEEYLISGYNLLVSLSMIKEHAGLKNDKCLFKLNDRFGMMQLLEAITSSDSYELESTIIKVKQIVNKFPEFKFESLKKKLVIWAFLFSPDILHTLLHKIIKHYKK